MVKDCLPVPLREIDLQFSVHDDASTNTKATTIQRSKGEGGKMLSSLIIIVDYFNNIYIIHYYNI